MVRGITLLLGCQLAGEAATRGFGLPVPGPVIGLVLLLLILIGAEALGRVRRQDIEVREIGRIANGLLGHLGLLFVPAGVGLVQHLDLLRRHGLAISLALVVSTVMTLIITVGVFLLVKRIAGAGRR